MQPSNITARRSLRLVIAAVSAAVLCWASCGRKKSTSEPPGPVPVIVAPATGTVVAPGASVHVVVQTSSTRVLLVGRGTSATDDAAPFEFDLLIPTEAVGPFPIQAFGASATGTFAGSNTVTLNVQPGSLQSMRIVSGDVILKGPGDTESLAVLGTYSDGVTRDITHASTGTTYYASSGGGVSVSPAGLVTWGSPGTATVVARNGRHQASVRVTVLP
jgi:hypothetical protein